jgi:O-antigen ligase
MMLDYGILFHILPFFFLAIALTMCQVRHLMYWMIYASIIVLVVCWHMGQVKDDRFFVPDIPAFANPNDLAFGLLFGCAFALLLAYKRSVVSRLIWVATLPVAIVYTLKTGSRAGFLTLLFLVAVILLLAPRRTKLAVLLLSALMGALAPLTVPAATWQRLTFILLAPNGSEVQDRSLASAADSQAARTELQKRAVQLTIHHPLLGVGPFMFEDAVEDFVQREEGHKSGWQGPHNVYLQVAAENGVPALLFYVASIIFCVKMNYRSYKLLENDQNRQLERMQSFCLLLATLDYAFGILFCNVAYYPYLSLLVAFTAANYLAVQKELRPQSLS